MPPSGNLFGRLNFCIVYSPLAHRDFETLDEATTCAEEVGRECLEKFSEGLNCIVGVTRRDVIYKNSADGSSTFAGKTGRRALRDQIASRLSSGQWAHDIDDPLEMVMVLRHFDPVKFEHAFHPNREVDGHYALQLIDAIWSEMDTDIVNFFVRKKFSRRKAGFFVAEKFLLPPAAKCDINCPRTACGFET